jgi:exopolysaccharide biosynthesis polyprenyl glycosylphosphotransferase
MLHKKKIHFEVSERKILLRIFDILSVFFSLYIVSDSFEFDYFKISQTNFLWFFVLGVYINIFGSVFEMYNLQVASNQFQVMRSIVLTSATTVLFYLLTPYYTPMLPGNRLQIVYFFLAIFFGLFLWRMFYQKYLASHRFEKRVLLVCGSDQVDELYDGLLKVDPHYKILAFLDTNQLDIPSHKTIVPCVSIATMEQFVQERGISEIVIATQDTQTITLLLYNKLLHFLESGYSIKEYSQVYESITQRIPIQFVSGDFYKYFPFNRNNQNQLYLVAVRVIEIIISLVGVTITLFLLPLILVGNLMGNKGDLFYTQERVGKNGNVFRIIKFRTMVMNAEKNGAVFATTNDTRITRFGKFLRKSRLDEFPQFINVIKGEMGVIGPRPERPVFVDKIAEVMPFYQTRHVIKPGLTGWAQVNYSYGDSIDDSLIKLQYDLYYIKHRSIFLDMNITIKTFSTVLFYRGQ